MITVDLGYIGTGENMVTTNVSNLVQASEERDRTEEPITIATSAQMEGLSKFIDENGKVFDPKKPTPPVPKKRGKKLDVAEAIVHFAGEKAKYLKVKLQMRDQEAKDAERFIKEKTKRLRIIRNSTGSLSEKLKEMEQSKRSELVAKYRKVVTQLKLNPYVEKFYTDRDMRIYFVTHPLPVKKESWPVAKIAGRYEIRIDFSKSNISEGIHILNITQRSSDYDGPTILDTRPCWGNLCGDIENEFNSQDLYELVGDLIDYIKSEKEQNGYLGKNGDKTKGWEQFFDTAKPQPDNFCFAKYEQGIKSKVVIGSTTGIISDAIYNNLARASSEWSTVETQTISLGGNLTTASGTSQVSMEQLRSAMSAHANQLQTERDMQNPYVRVREGERMSWEQYELSHMLMEAGIRERSSYYFMLMMSEDLIEHPDMRINRIQIDGRGGQYVLLVYAERPLRAVAMTEDPSPTMDIESTRTIFKYYANTRDFNPETLEALSHGQQRVYSRQQFNHAYYQEESRFRNEYMGTFPREEEEGRADRSLQERLGASNLRPTRAIPEPDDQEREPSHPNARVFNPIDIRGQI